MKNICFALTGAFFEIDKALAVVTQLNKTFNIKIVLSSYVQNINPLLAEKIEKKFGKPVTTIAEAERICPNNLSDALVIFPCTGNTLAKIANGISDDVVPFLAKAHARNFRPVVFGISTNDGLGLNMLNIARLMNEKEMYFVPFFQDNFEKKPKSLVCKPELIEKTLIQALEREQVQPVLWRDNV